MSSSHSFEDQFFRIASKPERVGTTHTAFKKIALSTRELKQAGAKVAATRNELHVTGLSLEGMKKVASVFSLGGSNIELELDEEITNFEPEDGLVYKSKAPLWVLKKTSNNSVVIQRIWK